MLIKEEKMEEKRTGFASIDKPWMKYYRQDAEDIVNNIPQNKTVWDVIEEKIEEVPTFENEFVEETPRRGRRNRYFE